MDGAYRLACEESINSVTESLFCVSHLPAYLTVMFRYLRENISLDSKIKKRDSSY